MDLARVVVSLLGPRLAAIDEFLKALLRYFNRLGLALNVVARCLPDEKTSTSSSLSCTLHGHVIRVDVVLRLASPTLVSVPVLVQTVWISESLSCLRVILVLGGHRR